MLSFGALLQTFRLGRKMSGRRRRNGTVTWVEYPVLSQNHLALLAGLHPAVITRLERGIHEPRRESVERLAEVLELDDRDRARFLIAAGYWPWPELDDDQTEAALAVLFAVGSGDWRVLDAHAVQNVNNG